MITVIGYAVRVFGLFLVGGLWACLHKSEADPKKLFQLGIVAPAMITGMISASNVHTDNGAVARSQPQVTADVSPAAPQVSARAPNSSRGIPQDRFANRETSPGGQPPPDPKPVDEFIRGLLGRP